MASIGIGSRIKGSDLLDRLEKAAPAAGLYCERDPERHYRCGRLEEGLLFYKPAIKFLHIYIGQFRVVVDPYLFYDTVYVLEEPLASPKSASESRKRLEEKLKEQLVRL